MQRHVLCLFLLLVAEPAQANNRLAEACRDVYLQATANVRSEARHARAYSSLYNRMCSNRSVRQGFSLGIVDEGLLSAFGLNVGSTQERQEAFCRNFSESNFTEETTTLNERIIQQDALANFNACVSIAASNVSVTHVVNEPDSVFFQFFLGNTASSVRLTGVQTSDNVVCTSNPEGLESVTFTSSFSVSCRRVGIETEEGVLFRRGYVAFGTDRSDTPFQVTLQESLLLRPEFAIEAGAEISRLSSELARQRRQAETDSNRANQLAARLDRVETRSILLFRGDRFSLAGFSNTEPRFYNIGCRCFDGTQHALCEGWGFIPSFDNVCRSRLGDSFRYQSRKQLSSVSGGNCGSSFFLIDCVRK